MRNLYRELGIHPESSETTVHRAVQRSRLHNPELFQNANAILLKPKRKASYDRVLHKMLEIGTLRKETEHETTPFWSSRDQTHFGPEENFRGRRFASSGSNFNYFSWNITSSQIWKGAAVVFVLSQLLRNC